MADVGYGCLTKDQPKRNRLNFINILRKRREMGDLPPVYPNGWFHVMESRYLGPGKAKPTSALGKFKNNIFRCLFWAKFAKKKF